MVSLEEALIHLGYEKDDAAVTNRAQRALNAAKKRLDGSVGSDLQTYMPDDPRADELIFAYLDELWDERGVTSAKATNATRRAVFDMEWQLRLELRQAKEAAGYDL